MLANVWPLTDRGILGVAIAEGFDGYSSARSERGRRFGSG
jgi:hypothetical protein